MIEEEELRIDNKSLSQNKSHKVNDHLSKISKDSKH